MNIKVNLEYRDSRRRIQRGIYPASHPDLQEMREWLIVAGHAVYTDESATVSMPETGNQVAEADTTPIMATVETDNENVTASNLVMKELNKPAKRRR